MHFKNLFSFFKDGKKNQYLFIVLLSVFLILTAIVLLLPTTVIDLQFSEVIQKTSTPTLDFLMRAISWFGATPVAATIVIGSALIFAIRGCRREAIFTLATLLVSVITFGIKILIDRPRPGEELVNIVEEVQYQSFPSGHTSFYVVFFGFIIFLLVRNRYFVTWLRYAVVIVLLVLIFSIPFSRIYLGAHWFTDVAAGFVLGILVLWGLIRGYLYESKRTTN
ncbi:MAG: phosphatase PAP2 family protein [Bacteroidales bacterium]|nr:phosphatase PAP2 family protein [Bacteroidales bacterium]